MKKWGHDYMDDFKVKIEKMTQRQTKQKSARPPWCRGGEWHLLCYVVLLEKTKRCPYFLLKA